jgi:uncharacterized membrane protein YfcA
VDMALAHADILVLGLAALLTSVLSAIVGMAGGITLLAIMLLFMDPLEAIPLHGVIQLASNGSRTWIQRSHVRWPWVLRYSALLLPVGVVGLAFARHLPPAELKAIIGLFVLVATWLPGALLLGAHPDRIDPGRRFFLLGAVVGGLNMAIGATGPLIAPFFLNLGLTRFELIGTKAACQAAGHLAKIGLFGAAGFAFGDHALLLAVMLPMVVVGTSMGSRILHRVGEAWFTRLYKGVLSLVAVRLIVSAWTG